MKRYRYVGKEKDGESGLYYYGARYYAAWVGRFISVDPLAAKYSQLTPYNYAANNPIGDLDIDGLQNTQTEEVPSGGGGPTTLPVDPESGLPTATLSEVKIIGTSPFPEGHKVTNTMTSYSVDGYGIPHSQALSETKVWHIGGVHPSTGEDLAGGWMSEQDYMNKVFVPLLNDYRVANYGGARIEESQISKSHTEYSREQALCNMEQFVAARDSIAGWVGEALYGIGGELGAKVDYKFNDYSGSAIAVYPEADLLMLYRGLTTAVVKSATAQAKAGGRLGLQTTRDQIDAVAIELESRGYQITGGGGRLPEEYLRPLGGGRSGGSYLDITAVHPEYGTIRINTVDVLNDGFTPTAREMRNAIRIRSQIAPGEHLMLIPKR